MGRKALNRICPICGETGSGAYGRWVRNGRSPKQYKPYYYFKHLITVEQGGKLVKKIKWCYMTKEQYDDYLKTLKKTECREGQVPP